MKHFNKIVHTLFRLCALIVIIIATIGNTFVEAKSSDTRPQNISSLQESGSSTPELIEQAFVNGEITAEQRLLYLTYALYDYESLPIQFHGTVGWSGTSYVRAIQNTLGVDSTAKPLDFSAVQEEISLLSAQAGTVCDREDGPNSTETTHFYLSYDTIGGGLTIESYKNSLETTFSTEVTNYGWPKPPFCISGVGTCSTTNPWNKYPVQIVEMPDPTLTGYITYGYVTALGGLYTGQVGDNANTSETETSATATCMVLNRDFTGYPGTPQNALNATTAHEFVHAVQYGIVDSYYTEDHMWFESSATYMEDEAFDEINDNYQYLWPDFTSCQGAYPSGRDDPLRFSNWLFFRYAAEHNGGTNVAGGGEDIMQAFWTNVAAGQTGLTAYNNALGIKGTTTTLADTFHNYAIAARFSKACPLAEPYCFEEAADYITKKGTVGNLFQMSIDNPVYSNGAIQNNYAINYIGLPITGSYSITLDVTSASGELRGTIVADLGDRLDITPLPNIVSPERVFLKLISG